MMMSSNSNSELEVFDNFDSQGDLIISLTDLAAWGRDRSRRARRLECRSIDEEERGKKSGFTSRFSTMTSHPREMSQASSF